MSLYKFMTCFIFVSLNSATATHFGCKEQLKQQIWPLDCFLYLEIKKVHKKSRPYENLNTWCKLHEEDLFNQSAPAALFSLYTPPHCKKVAQKAQRAAQSLKILKGDFLNSFP